MFRSQKIEVTALLLLLCILLMLLAVQQAAAQCTTPQVRHYASTEQYNAVGLSNVVNSGNAVDGNPATFSKLNRAVAVLSNLTQFLKFEHPVTPGNLISSGTPVTVKLTIPSGLLSVLGGVEIQPFKNLHDAGILGWQADAVGSAISGATLLGLLSGAGDQEITITPTGDFEGVWIKLSGVAVGQSISIYEAYFMKAAAANYACNAPVDALSGVKPMTTLANIGSTLGTVANPSYAVDGNVNTYAEINAIANVLNQVYHSTVFATPSQKGDTVKMILQNTGSGLLDLGVGSGFSVQLYNGNTPVGSPITYSASSLSLKLLYLGSDKYQLDISPPSDDVYDRVEVRVGGVATLGLTQGLRIYDVKRILATPLVDNNLTASTSNICYGTATTLAVSNPQDCTTYNWYDAVTNNLLYTGASYALPTNLSLGTHTYYVTASRSGCTETFNSVVKTVIVNPLPAITPTTANGCTGHTSATLNYTGGVNSPATYSIVWDAGATGFANVTDAALPSATNGAITLAIPAAAAAATYTGNLTVKNANQCVSNNIPISVTVHPLPASPVLSITN